jgi:hypothetical protein
VTRRTLIGLLCLEVALVIAAFVVGGKWLPILALGVPAAVCLIAFGAPIASTRRPGAGWDGMIEDRFKH